MNKLYRIIHNNQAFNLFVLILGLFVFAPFTQAADISIQLDADAKKCTVALKFTDGNGCDEKQCAGDTDCLCAGKGDHITWLLEGTDKFKLKFSTHSHSPSHSHSDSSSKTHSHSDSPLKENCGKNFKASKHKCVVKDEVVKGQSYGYEIYLESCSNGTDPKIVIK